MGIYGGLKPEDWQRWGQFTTFKQNPADLLARQVRAHQRTYCSPLVDPYQPAEETERAMPPILDALIADPPALFVIQTRGPLVLRDLRRLLRLSSLTTMRVSFSITTNREEVRRRYEPRCPTFDERLTAIRQLRVAGVEVYATLAPLLPCDPEVLAEAALEATGRDLIGDPLHVRSVKPHGATTRAAAFRIAGKHNESAWLDAGQQKQIVERIRQTARSVGRDFTIGPEGFAVLASPPPIAEVDRPGRFSYSY